MHKVASPKGFLVATGAILLALMLAPFVRGLKGNRNFAF